MVSLYRQPAIKLVETTLGTTL